jgi:transcriptional antiterminator RfaH
MEKSLARRLREREVSFFLPLYRRRWKQRGRAFNSYLPLFPGYLFVYGDPDARLTALQTNLVTCTLPVPDQGRLQTDLLQIHQLLTTGAPVTPEDRLQPGSRVRVTRGPFEGLEGKILRREQQLRFVVEVQLLQRGVSLNIESWMFEPIGSAATDPGHKVLCHN